jgi:hypothetical protein
MIVTMECQAVVKTLSLYIMEGVFIDDLVPHDETTGYPLSLIQTDTMLSPRCVDDLVFYEDTIGSPAPLMRTVTMHSPRWDPHWDNWSGMGHIDIPIDTAIVYRDPTPELTQQEEPMQQPEPPQPRLNRRGLPMRNAAMHVAERVAKIVSWENANENSDIVRRIAAQIDGEICDEASRKRKRSSTSQHHPIPTEDSECDDGADDVSEWDDKSEPDPDEEDAEFDIHDDGEIEDNDEYDEEESGTEYGSEDEYESETESENEYDKEDESEHGDVDGNIVPVSATGDEELVSMVDSENVL